MLKISIIIPVFNAEKYLVRCVDSILEALGDIQGEILLIDNDSSDNSLKIARDYQERFPGVVRVLQCHTPGAAAVRNFGVIETSGEYLWFIDADDYIDQTAITKLLEVARDTKADLVMMGAKRLMRDGSTSYLSAVEAGRRDTRSRFIRYGMGPWQVLIRRRWWTKCGFRFAEGMIHEDMELMSSLALYTDQYASIDEPLYFYCDNPESVLHKSQFDPHVFDIFPALEGLYKRFEKAKAVKKYHDELEWFFIWNLLIDSAKDFGTFPEGRVGFSHSRQILNQYFPTWRKNRFLRQKPLKLRIRIKMNYYKK